MKYFKWTLVAIVTVIVTIWIVSVVDPAEANSEYSSDLNETRQMFSDGIVLQCAQRQQALQCNWDRYNEELKAK